MEKDCTGPIWFTGRTFNPRIERTIIGLRMFIATFTTLFWRVMVLPMRGKEKGDNCLSFVA